MCLAQGPQRSDAGEARTRGPSVSSQAGSISDQMIVKPDPGPNYLQKNHLNLLSVICQLYPYVKQYGSRSDLTIVKLDLGPNFLQKFTSTSFQLNPYVKQYGSRSDLTIVKPDVGPNYLQKFTATSY